MPFVFGVLGSSKPMFNMISFAHFIQRQPGSFPDGDDQTLFQFI
jgi:hypothetical protein